MLAAIVLASACGDDSGGSDASVRDGSAEDGGVECGDTRCAAGEMCCSPGCDEDGDPLLVCDDDCAFTPTGPVYECM